MMVSQIFSLMIKTEIIGFCQKINRIVKLVELSGTLTKQWRGSHGHCSREGGGARIFFLPLRFFKPIFFWIYWWWTTENKFQVYWPPPLKKKPNPKPIKTNINHILVQFLHRDLFFSCLLNLGFETIILLALTF